MGRVPVACVPVGRAPVGRVPVACVPVGRVPVGRVPVGCVRVAPVGRVPVKYVRTRIVARLTVEARTATCSMTAAVRSGTAPLSTSSAWSVSTRKASHERKPRWNWHSSCRSSEPIDVKTESMFAEGMPRMSSDVSDSLRRMAKVRTWAASTQA